MIIFNIPVSGSLKVKPASNMSIVRASLIETPQQLLQKEQLDYGNFFIHLPTVKSFTRPFVIVLETKPVQKGDSETGPKAKT
jgi:alpha-L-fucosidase